MSSEALRRRAALKAITVGAQMTSAEHEQWIALDPGAQSEYRRRAGAEAEARMKREVRRDLRVHERAARRTFATMSRDLQRTLGLEGALNPCDSRHRRAPGVRPVRRRGSRRTSGAPTRGDPDDGEGDPPGVSHPPTRGKRAGRSAT
jgi:hypothetical protein